MGILESCCSKRHHKSKKDKEDEYLSSKRNFDAKKVFDRTNKRFSELEYNSKERKTKNQNGFTLKEKKDDNDDDEDLDSFLFNLPNANTSKYYNKTSTNEFYNTERIDKFFFEPTNTNKNHNVNKLKKSNYFENIEMQYQTFDRYGILEAKNNRRKKLLVNDKSITLTNY